MKDFDDTMDDFDFKPLTKGLGFHHSLQEKTKLKTDLKLQSESLKSDLDERAKKLLSDSSHQTMKTTHMGELSPFYEEIPTLDEIPSLKNITDKKIEYRYFDAPMNLRLKAWVMDMGVIITMFAVTVGSLFLLVDMPFDVLAKVMISADIAPSMLLIFSLFYVFYFSTLDKTAHSTLGKNFFNIKVIGMREDMTLLLSTFKCILSLFSIVSMGMLTVLSVPDQISKTRVVQK